MSAQASEPEPRPQESEPASGAEGRRGEAAAPRAEGSVAASLATLLTLPQPRVTSSPLIPPPLGQLQSLYQGAPPGAFSFGLPQRFGSEAWSSVAAQRISMMATQRLSSAEIRLDPPELGSLHVRLTLHQDQASLSFSSPHPQVRDALEQQMPRLREMLAESGINLQQSDVSDQGFGGSRQRQDPSWPGGHQTGDSGAETAPAARAVAVLSLVDAYA